MHFLLGLQFVLYKKINDCFSDIIPSDRPAAFVKMQIEPIWHRGFEQVCIPDCSFNLLSSDCPTQKDGFIFCEFPSNI